MFYLMTDDTGDFGVTNDDDIQMDINVGDYGVERMLSMNWKTNILLVENDWSHSWH